MKKIIYYSAIGLLAFFLVFIIFKYKKYQAIYQKQAKEYYSHVDVFSDNTDVFNDYAEVYNRYFHKNFRYPENTASIMKFIKKDTNFAKLYVYLLKDPFSKTGANLLYYPLYSKKSNNPEGMVLISAGIDGKLNTKLKDTLFIDDIKKLKFYNKVQDPTNYFKVNHDTTFSLYNYLFGKRDLLVYYRDEVGSYEHGFRKYSVGEIYDFIRHHSIRHHNKVKMYVTLTGKTSLVEKNMIVLSDNDINAKCIMYKGRKNSIQPGDSVQLVCDYKGKYDSTTKTIYFNNCVPLIK